MRQQKNLRIDTAFHALQRSVDSRARLILAIFLLLAAGAPSADAQFSGPALGIDTARSTHLITITTDRAILFPSNRDDLFR